MSSIAAKLCQHRAATKLTQQEIAERLGIKPNTYGSWEAGHTYPSGRYFPELATIFDVPIAQLFPDRNGKAPNKTNTPGKKMNEIEALKLVLQSKEEVIEAKEAIIAAQVAQIEKLQEELEKCRTSKGRLG